ncbi:MAG TPA: hypothetical protein VN285_10455 [Candidatus Deferrimicrobium sp.]|nr:hypothetical protein [Candidatus Deferrimicrobium sp.]
MTGQKLNCWQFKNCGREKGGLAATLYGECPVSTAMELDGLNGGIGGGRACWMVPAAVCRQEKGRRGRGHPCLVCEFYQRVIFEEGSNASCTFTPEPIRLDARP